MPELFDPKSVVRSAVKKLSEQGKVHLAMSPEEWDASEHPRDDSGQFTDKVGGDGRRMGDWTRSERNFWIVDGGEILPVKSMHENDMWDYFVETNEPGFEGLPKSFDIEIPEEEIDAFLDDVWNKSREKAFEQKGFIRVSMMNTVEVADFSSSTLKRIAKGVYRQFGDEAYDLTYDLENVRNNKFVSSVPFDVLKRGSTSQLRQYF